MIDSGSPSAQLTSARPPHDRPDNPPERTAFVTVSVAGAPSVLVCIDPTAGDAVAPWLIDHDWIDEPVQRAFVGSVRPGAKVLDLGSHLGLFSLSASALGASVLAVDANSEHTRLLSAAGARNGFDDLHVANVALADPDDGTDTVRFIPRSIHGHVLGEGESAEGSIEVTATTVDRLLADLDWDRLDVIKMDIEGSEIAALRGMAGLFATGCRPAIVIESNASMLGQQGSSVPALRGMLADLGYELFLIDHLRPGVLVETTADAIQTESASDLLALAERPGDLTDRWEVEGPLTTARIVTRLLDAAASPASGYRLHSADVLRDGPPWLRSHGAVGPALEALANDVTAEVRVGHGSGTRSAGLDYHDAPEPLPGGADEPVVVWARHLSVRRHRFELERPVQLATPEHEVVLRDVSFHVNRGEPIAVLSTEPARSDMLLAALAGEDVVADGSIDVRGHVISLRSLGSGLEPGLSVGDNVALFGAYLGCHVPVLEARRPDLLAIAGLTDRADHALQDVGAASAQRLALAVAFECTQPDLLLLGDLPVVDEPGFGEWLTARAAHLRNCGTSVIQVVREPASLLIEPSRVLWFDGDRLRACGHPESVIEAVRLDRLGFDRTGTGWRERSR